MSKHWDPRRSGWAGQWDRHRWAVQAHRKPRRRWGLRNWQLNLLTLLAVYAAVMLYTFVDPHSSATTLPSEGRGQIAAPAAVRVIDGDTFDYDGMRVRIADIDTPEVNGSCAYETELAARATGRLDALLGEGPFELHPVPDGRDEDRYGRKLRIVTRRGRSVGDMLVAEGLARTWSGRREPWCV
ncbi:MAG TPA: thermonuclease family protein [Allosphingosinicella sp.]|nr:thermonuclease family protein [Allosphingosinicella sp.]